MSPYQTSETSETSDGGEEGGPGLEDVQDGDPVDIEHRHSWQEDRDDLHGTSFYQSQV